MSLVYLIPIILAIVWSIEYDGQKEFDDRKSHRFWFLCIVLSLITGLSYALGGDKQIYLTEFCEYSPYLSDLFREIEAGIMTRGQMPGWVLLNVLARAIFNSFYVVQLIEAFFINFVVFYTCKRYTQRVFFFVLLYCVSFQYFNLNTEVMREAFAIGFCLLGAEMLFRRKYLLTGILFALAFSFHFSAIAMIVLFPFMKFRISVRRFPYVLLTALLFWFISNTLFNIIIELVFGREGAILSKLLGYSSYSTGIVACLIYMVIFLVAPFLIMHLAIGKGEQDEVIIRRKEQFATYYLCIAIVVPSFLPLSRFFNYMMPILLCFTTDLLFTLFQEKRHFIPKVICILLFWGYSVFQFIAYVPRMEARYLCFWFPYTSILDEYDYDRTLRDTKHDLILSVEKTEENTREAD